MPIQKIVRSSISQQVFDQLRSQLEQGVWKPGDKLPSENELAAQFGVSRVTIRNALQRLCGQGLLETRFGEGSFVCQPPAPPDAGLPTLEQLRRLLEHPAGSTADLTALRALLDSLARGSTPPDTDQKEGPAMISTVYQNVTHMEQAYADRVAIQYYDEQTRAAHPVTYREYAADIRRFVAYLQQSVPDIKGRHIGILARNSYHYAVCIFGSMLAGAVLVPLNIGKSWDELHDEIERADISYILQDGAYAEREPAFAQEYGSRLLEMHGFTRCETLAELTECDDVDALALIMFTSGTTGRSKGVMLSMRNLFAPMGVYIAPFEALRQELKLGDNYQFASFNILPMFHIACFTSLISWSMTGSTVNLCTDPRYFYRDIKAMDSDLMCVVPVLLKSIHHDVMKGNRSRLGRLRILTCAAAAADSQVLAELMQNGFHIIQMYGLTETVGDGAWNASQEARHLASVGQRDPSCEYKLEEGELCIKGDVVMMGYYKDPEATAEILQDGWLHTGDLARMDEDGFIYLTGRKKNLIILSSGENVSPEELEALLMRCEDVREAIAKEKGDRICAEVYCAEERQQAVRDHITRINRRLPLYKRINAVEFRAEPFPRTATGKIQRR